eukprot:4333302-Alexandrium_andersonii.AAC.1
MVIDEGDGDDEEDEVTKDAEAKNKRLNAIKDQLLAEGFKEQAEAVAAQIVKPKMVEKGAISVRKKYSAAAHHESLCKQRVEAMDREIEHINQALTEAQAARAERLAEHAKAE